MSGAWSIMRVPFSQVFVALLVIGCDVPSKSSGSIQSDENESTVTNFDDEAGDKEEAGEEPEPRPELDPEAYAMAQEIVGEWLGYGENADSRFPSRSDRVELHVTSVGRTGEVVGTLAFGEPGTLPPVTDPDVAYPPRVGGLDDPGSVFEHFTYSFTGFYDPAIRRFQGTFLSAEVWAEWCLLQTSFEDDDNIGRWSCLPNCGSTQTDGVCHFDENCSHTGVVDCDKIELCGLSQVCACDESGCVHSDRAGSFDFHLVGDEFDGNSSVGPTRLVRQ